MVLPELEELQEDIRAEAVSGVVDEDPGVEIFAPEGEGPVKILADLADARSGIELVRSVDGEESALRPKIAIVLAVTDFAPGANPNKVTGVIFSMISEKKF